MMLLLKYWKFGLIGLIILTIGSIGYFGKRYLEDINQEKLNLAVSLSEVSEQLNSQVSESQQKDEIVNAYVDLAFETSIELERVKNEHSKLEGQFNEIQFSKHFEKWANTNPEKLGDCMSNGFNRLFDNLSAATNNQVQAHQNPMSCPSEDGKGDSPASVTTASNDQ